MPKQACITKQNKLNMQFPVVIEKEGSGMQQHTEQTVIVLVDEGRQMLAFAL